MPRKSKVVLSPSELEELLENVLDTISTLNRIQLKEFMKEFLTDEEQIMISKRFALYKFLYQGFDLFEIQQTLGISRETTRIYNQQKHKKTKLFKSILENAIKKDRLKSNTKKIAQKLQPLSYALEAKSNMRSRAKLLNPDID